MQLIDMHKHVMNTVGFSPKVLDKLEGAECWLPA